VWKEHCAPFKNVRQPLSSQSPGCPQRFLVVPRECLVLHRVPHSSSTAVGFRANATAGRRLADVNAAEFGRPSPDHPAPGTIGAWMVAALSEAHSALEHGDVPVGAVVVIDGRIVAARHNERELTGDPTAHAEVLALRDAAATRDGWRLSDATLVVTLEPCPMCAGAALAARVGSVVFAAPDPAGGALGSSYHVGSDPRLGYEFDVVSGPGALESAELLRAFFGDRRA
jgi:tRNA(adenine34) deaminase